MAPHSETGITTSSDVLQHGTLPAGMRIPGVDEEVGIDEAVQEPLAEAQRTLEGLLFENQRFDIETLTRGSFVNKEALVEALQNYPLSNECREKFAYLAREGILALTERDQKLVFAINTTGKDGQPRAAETIAFLVENELLQRLAAYSNSNRVTLLLLASEDFEEIHEYSHDKGKRDSLLKQLSMEETMAKVFHQLVRIGVQNRASDIHIEPVGNQYRVRYRIDGVLHNKYPLEMEAAKQLIAVIKNESEMKHDERRRPQDGRIFFDAETERSEPLLRGLSLRASVIPAMGGNKAVLRLLRSATKEQFNLEKLGFPQDIVDGLEELISEPHGLIVVTGPTGSGKTTTLYSMLARLNTGEYNILTIEDPVEVQMPGITQVQVNKAVDLTFAEALKSFLRQDPDIMLVGEVRDSETAEMAAQAALTGHLVLSTIHANDSFATIDRLKSLGLNYSQIKETLRGVFSQRLVRALCEECNQRYDAKDQLNEILRQPIFKEPLMLRCPPSPEHTGKKCSCCNGMGYKGRIVVPELWKVGEAERELIIAGSNNPSEYLRLARAQGMNTMMDYALAQVQAGYTSLKECIGTVFSYQDLRARREHVAERLIAQV